MARRTDLTSVPLAEDVWLHESRTIENGRIVKFRIQVLLYPLRGQPEEIVRYDSAHGGPHIHRPVGSPLPLEPVPANSMDEAISICERDLFENIDEYIRIVRRRSRSVTR